MNTMIGIVRARVALWNIGQGELASEAGVSPATVRVLIESDEPNLMTKSIEAMEAATRRIGRRRWQDAKVHAPTIPEVTI